MSRDHGRPRLFVASSREGEKLALAIQRNLQDMEVALWAQGVFRLTTCSLDSLGRRW